MQTPPSTKALAVAYLTAQGKRQNEIAHILNISQAAVSRLYADVKDEYIERTFRERQLDKRTLLEVRRLAAPETLRARLQELAEANGKQGPVVYRMPTSSKEPIGEFALQAAAVVKDLICGVRSTVGVAWGNTIWNVSQALRTLQPQKPWRYKFPVEFVPLCGDPLMDSVEVYADRTSSRIASELSKIFNGDEDKTRRPAWLGLVPAFIPRNSFKEHEIRVINKLIDLVPQYGRIFGPRVSPSTATPIAADLDMILTSAGPAEHPIGFGRSPLLKLDKKDAEVLAKNIYGDIGGVLVPRPGNTRGQEDETDPLVSELTDHWTGLRMEHLENCSKRAFQQNHGQGDRPGVVLLGFGADRAPLVLEAVRRGLVNHLVVSSDLETAIASLLPKEASPERATSQAGTGGRRSGMPGPAPRAGLPANGRARGGSV